MKRMIALLCLITLSAVAFAADINVVMTVINVTTLENGRKAVVDVQIPDGISLSVDATLLSLVGPDRKDVRQDEFGPPQNFALRGTSHEIATHHFQISVSLPKEKVTVQFLLRDGRQTLLDTKRDI